MFEIGAFETMAGKPKIYGILGPGENSSNPEVGLSAAPTALRFQVGEPAAQLHSQACRCRLRLHLWAEETVWGAEPVVVAVLNGVRLAGLARSGDAHTPPGTAESGRWLECTLGQEEVAHGGNELVLSVEGAASGLRLDAVQLHVAYQAAGKL